MSQYTDSRSRPLAIGTGTDDRAQALRVFGGLVLTAWDAKVSDYENLQWIKQVGAGKSDTFPVIGRKRDASDHTPGEVVLGGTVEGDEVEITLDNMLFDSIFVAEIDTLLGHFDVMGPYAQQLGESLAVTTCKRAAIMHILASRLGAAYTGGPVPGYSYASDMKTNPASIENAFAEAANYFATNEIDMGAMQPMLPWQQYLLLSRYSGIEGGPVTTGTGDRSSGTVGRIMGFKAPNGTNYIPKTTITTGPTKYQIAASNTVGHISTSMAVGCLRRKSLTVTRLTKEDRFGTLMIASILQGMGPLRQECAYELSTSVSRG